MNDNKLLNQIGNLIDNKLQPLKQDLTGVKQDLNGVKKDMAGVKKQLNTVELKVELANNRVNQLGGQLNQTEKRLEKAIVKSQEETIEVLSALMHTGYNMHEKRIRKIEDKLQIANSQQ
ncbi:MAG: hypothetical protein AAB583_02990 [Patescibacteria group bacterium]